MSGNANPSPAVDKNAGRVEPTGQTLDTRKIPVKLIVVPKGFNARTSLDARKDGESEGGTTIEMLAENIKTSGLHHPITVRPIDGGKFAIVMGFRRFAAMMLLKWEEIPCSVKVLSDMEASITNLDENLQREDLLPGEVATKAAEISEKYGMSNAKIADRVGLSKSYIGNLVRIKSCLHPKIWESCMMSANPPADQSMLLKWVKGTTKNAKGEFAPTKEDYDRQWTAYCEHTGQSVDGGDVEGAGEGESGSGAGTEEQAVKPRRPTQRKLEEALEAVIAGAKAGDVDAPEGIEDVDSWLLGLEGALRFASGKPRGKGLKILKAFLAERAEEEEAEEGDEE